MKHLALVLITLLIMCAAVFVWPTRYRYDHVQIGRVTLPVRMDRITGRSEVFSPMTKTWSGPR